MSQDLHELVDVTIAMATCNDDLDVLAEVLTAARAQAAGPILVVDMSMDDRIKDLCRDIGPSVEYHLKRDSRGLSDSRNAAIRMVRTRFVLFLDADAIPVAGWASALRMGLDTEGVAVCGARCLPRWTDWPPRLMRTGLAGDFFSLLDLGDIPLDVPRIVGTSFGLNLERLPADPFPIDLGLGAQPHPELGGEEVAVCLRALADGWRVLYEPRACVQHHIRPQRATWRAMFRRAHNAGKESRREGDRLEPLPREVHWQDRVFQVIIAPSFVAGWMRRPGPGRPTRFRRGVDLGSRGDQDQLL